MLIAGIIIVVCIFAFVIIRGKKRPVIPTKDVDILGLEEILKYFKQPEIISELKTNTNLMAVATKEIKKDGTNYIIACLFDKQSNSITNFEKANAWNAKKLDERLTQTFGDRDMIVLK